jgi:hypothetical protein
VKQQISVPHIDNLADFTVTNLLMPLDPVARRARDQYECEDAFRLASFGSDPGAYVAHVWRQVNDDIYRACGIPARLLE